MEKYATGCNKSSISRCDNTHAETSLDTLVSIITSLAWLKCGNAGASVNAVTIVWKASCCTNSHMNCSFFFVSLVNCLAFLEYLGINRREWLQNPKNCCTLKRLFNHPFFVFFSQLQFRIVRILSSSIEIPFGDIINPKFLTISLLNWHFSGFKFNSASNNCCSIHSTWPTSSSSESLYINI